MQVKPEKAENTGASCRLFPLLAAVMIITAQVASATYIFTYEDKSIFPWQPYAAFTLFIVLIFWMDWLILCKKACAVAACASQGGKGGRS